MQIRSPFLAIVIVSLFLFLLSACDPASMGCDSDDTGTVDVVDDTDTQDTDGTTDDGTDDSSDDGADDSGGTGNTGDAQIILNGTSITVNGTGASVSGSTVTISSAGSYNISGRLSDGQIVVDTDSDELVELVLNGVNIHNSSSSPINIITAEDVNIVLSAGTQNYLSDESSYVFTDGEDEPDATLFSKEDLTILGEGALIVDANYNNGIKSKDKLVIEAGNITVNSVDDAIIGKDFIRVEGGDITVDAGGDGLKSTEDEDAEKGYVSIEGGQLDIVSGADGIQAETYLDVSAGEINITSGGGNRATIGQDDSAKGLKAGTTITITGGTLVIDAADDAIHANVGIVIDGGTLKLASGDDAIHADATVTINGGDIDIETSSEGIEATYIQINDGNISIYATDDGINASAKSSGYSVLIEVNGGTIYVEVGPGDTDAFDSNGNIYINGGIINVVAQSAFDPNGVAQLNGGTVTVNGQVVTTLPGGGMGPGGGRWP